MVGQNGGELKGGECQTRADKGWESGGASTNVIN